MFVPKRIPRVTWKDYRRPPPKVINPMSLPTMYNSGFGEFGYIMAIITTIYDFISGYLGKKKQTRRRRRARAEYLRQLAEEEARIREEEERLRIEMERLERETATRMESAKTEYLKYQYPAPPVKSWGEAVASPGEVLIQTPETYKT